MCIYIYIHWWYRECWCHTICQTSNNCAPYWFASRSFEFRIKDMYLYLWTCRQSWSRKLTLFFPAQMNWSWKECSVRRSFQAKQYAYYIKNGSLYLWVRLSCFIWCPVFSDRGALHDGTKYLWIHFLATYIFEPMVQGMLLSIGSQSW